MKANRLGLGINSHQTKDEDNQIKISRKTKWTDHTREHQQLMWFGERSTSMVGQLIKSSLFDNKIRKS